jgi:hypothetical protein
VKSVDPLSTDEAYASIGAGRSDHNRRPPLAHLVSRTPMSTMEPLAFYARQKVHMKSSRRCMEYRSGTPCFLYTVMFVLKVIEAERYVDREPLAFYMW